MAPDHTAIERVSLAIFEAIRSLASEYAAQEDHEALSALAPVLLTTGVISLCQTLGPESTVTILGELRLKVERGDFAGLTAPGPDYRQYPQ